VRFFARVGGGWSIGDRRCSRGPGCFVPRQHPVDPPTLPFSYEMDHTAFSYCHYLDVRKILWISLELLRFVFTSRLCYGILKFVNNCGGRGLCFGSLRHRRTRYFRILWSENDHVIFVLQFIRSDWFFTVTSAMTFFATYYLLLTVDCARSLKSAFRGFRYHSVDFRFMYSKTPELPYLDRKKPARTWFKLLLTS
jgi:hypothetical protein